MAQQETSPQTVPPEKACSKAIMDLCNRTDIISFHGGDIIPAKTIPSLEKLTNLGMEKHNILFLQVVLKQSNKACHYEPALRGGFHREQELDSVNRVQMRLSYITKRYRNKRVIVRPSLADNQQGAIVVIDGMGSIVCIVALNALSNITLLGRRELVDTYEKEGKLFWSKGCSLSGNCNYSYMDVLFRDSLELPRQFGIGKDCSIHGIIPWSKKAKIGTKKGTGCETQL